MKLLVSITIASALLVLTAPAAQPDDNWVCSHDLDSQSDDATQRLFSVTQVQTVEFLNVSSDGQRFVFSGKTQPLADSSIWVCNLDGSDMRNLGKGTMPLWSPGGQRIVFSRTGSEQGVWIMRADGTNQRILDKRGSAATWSPDGTKIAWFRNIAGVVDIVVYNIVEDDWDLVFGSAGKDIAVASSQIASSQIAWSPNSRKVAFLAQGLDRQTTVCSVRLRSKFPVVERYLAKPAEISGVHWLDDQTFAFSQRLNKSGGFQLSTATAKNDSTMVAHPVRLSVDFAQRSNISVSATRPGTRLYFLSRSIGE